MDDDEMEPISVNGLGQLTSAQQALAEFLEVDEDLLAGAGMGSPASQDEEVSQKEMDAWINDLPRDEVKAVLKQLLSGQGQQAERTLKSRFAAWRRGLGGDGGGATRRSIGELRANAQAAERIRVEREKTRQEAAGSQATEGTRRVPEKPVQGFSQGVEVGSTDRRTGFGLSL